MDAYLGTILPVAFDYAPVGWALCNGQSLSTASYSALYALIGNRYGGNQTSFNLPDLCGRFPIGYGTSMNPTTPPVPAVNIGQRGGAATVALTTNNMPMHNHAASGGASGGTAALQVCKDPATVSEPTAGMVPAAPQFYDQSGNITGVEIYGYTSPSNNMINLPAVSLSNVNMNIQIGMAGGSLPFGIMNPYIGINYIICISGLWPSRQ